MSETMDAMKKAMKKPAGLTRGRCRGVSCPFTAHPEGFTMVHPKGFMVAFEGYCCGRCRNNDPGHGPCCTLEFHNDESEDERVDIETGPPDSQQLLLVPSGASSSNEEKAVSARVKDRQ